MQSSSLDWRMVCRWRSFDWRRFAALCCILLVAIGATAELTHAHASGRINPDCSLCVVAHSAAQTSVSTTAAVLLRPVSACIDPEPIVVGHKADVRLSIRPPPAAPVSR